MSVHVPPEGHQRHLCVFIARGTSDPAGRQPEAQQDLRLTKRPRGLGSDPYRNTVVTRCQIMPERCRGELEGLGSPVKKQDAA